MMSEREMESADTMTTVNTVVNLRMMSSMDKVPTDGQMGSSMRANGRMATGRVSADSRVPRGTATKANGRMTRNMVMESSGKV